MDHEELQFESKWANRLLYDVLPNAKSVSLSRANIERVKSEVQRATAPASIFARETALIESPFITDGMIVIVDRRGGIHPMQIKELLAPNFKTARWNW